jgi:hypothetical protein
MAEGTISVGLKMITDAFKKSLEEANERIRGLNKEFSKTRTGVSKDVGGLADDFKGLNVFTAISIAAIGTGLVTAFKACVNAAAESEAVVSKLNQIIKATGGVAGVTSEAAQELATSLQDVTAYDDEAIISGETMLLTFRNIGEKIFPRATESALDLATVMGTDVNAAMLMLGKALDNPVEGMTALQRAGVRLSATQKEQVEQFMALGNISKAQEIILDALTAKMGGAARAEAETYNGKMKQLKNTIGDLAENIGKIFLPALTAVASVLKTATKDLNDFLDSFSQKGAKIDALNGALEFNTKLVDDLNYKYNDLTKANWKLMTPEAVQANRDELADITAKLKALLELRKKYQTELNTAKGTNTTKSTGFKPSEDLTAPQIEANKKLEKLQQDLMQKRAQLNKDGLAQINADELKSIAELKDTKLAKTKAGEETALQITKLYADQRAEYEKKKNLETAQFTLTQAGSMVGQLGNLFSMYYANQKMEVDNNLKGQMDAIASGYDAEKANIEATVMNTTQRNAALKALDEKRTRDEKTAQEKADKDKRKIVREEAKRNKEISMVQVAINTAMAVMQAVATSGNIYAGIVLGVMMAALGAAQMELIRQQPLPALAAGGYASTATSAIFGEKGREVALPLDGTEGQYALSLLADKLINSIESKLNKSSIAASISNTASAAKDSAKNLFHVIVNVGSKVLYDDISEATENGEILIHARAIV